MLWCGGASEPLPVQRDGGRRGVRQTAGRGLSSVGRGGGSKPRPGIGAASMHDARRPTAVVVAAATAAASAAAVA